MDTAATGPHAPLEERPSLRTAEGQKHPLGPGPPLVLVVNNISKKQNVKTLLISAAAFGARVIIVQQPHFSVVSHVPTALRGKLSISRLESLERCREYLHDKGIRILGVEITEGAESVEKEPFNGPTALVMGNEGTGLSARQASICDGFVYIPQYGKGTASLNVAVAASIIMHRFCIWSLGQGQRPHYEQKQQNCECGGGGVHAEESASTAEVENDLVASNQDTEVYCRDAHG